MDPDPPIPAGARDQRRSALFLITSDPLASPRPAEAIRIAAGLGAWQKIQVSVYLDDTAVQGLAASPGRVRDEECFRQFLPVLAEAGPGAVLASERAGVAALEAGQSQVPLRKISDRRLAELAASSTWVLRF